MTPEQLFKYQTIKDPAISLILNLLRNYQFENALQLTLLLKSQVKTPQAEEALEQISLSLHERLKNDNARKVEFLVVGAQKAGTTALFKRLQAHPEICVPAFKELHYFDSQGISVTHKNYHRCFQPIEDERILGEVTPSYLYLDGVLEQIHNYQPELKLIVMLRDPIERAVSHFNMLHKPSVHRQPSLQAAYWIEYYKKEGGRSYFDIIGRGLYAQQLDRLFRLFPSENVLLVRSEDFRKAPETVLEPLSLMLGVSPFPDIDETIHHVGSQEQVLSSADAERLKDFYRLDCIRLHESYGVDTSQWLPTH